MTAPLFSKTTLRLVVALGSVSLLAALASAFFGSRDYDVQSTDADSFSKSAIGHAALIELIEASGRPVVRSRGRTDQKASRGALVLLLEPDPSRRTALKSILKSAKRALVVMPRWRGVAESEDGNWLESVEPIPVDRVNRVSKSCADDAFVIRRRTKVKAWTKTSGLDIDPELAAPQLIDSDSLAPMIEATSGVLLGRVRGIEYDRWLLSDPDLLSNHGLAKGSNAQLVLDILDTLAPRSEPVLIDETLHGHVVEMNLWGELGRFPLVLVLFQLFLASGFFLWAGMRRFGAPVPDEHGIGTGKAVLIENTSELLRFGGHSVSVLRRYLELEERRVASAWHIRSSTTEDRRERFAAIERRRGATNTIQRVARSVHAASIAHSNIEPRVLRAARDIARWREEMLHGHR